MNVMECMKQRRTVRFFQQRPVRREDLVAIIDCARMASCASNRQRLRYVVVTEPAKVSAVPAQTAWAGLVTPRRTPRAGETGPAAFVAVLAPEAADPILHADAGAAILSMELAAWELGLGCCWLGSVKRPAVKELLGIGEEQALLYLVALGYPAEAPVGEDVSDAGKVAYYLDDDNRLHVPKLSVDAVTRWC